MATHVVQPGESLWQIAQSYQTSIQDIIRLNQIQNPNAIYPGTILTIPSPSMAIQNAYLPVKSQYSKPRTEKITHVVIHFISNAGSKPRDPYNVQDIYNIFLNNRVSTHYMIGRNGEVYRLVDENRAAYHAGKGNLPGYPQYENRLNEYSIGIELLGIGTRDEMLTFLSPQTYDAIPPSDIGFTDAQYRSLNWLLNDIITRHPAIIRDRQHVVGHDEYAPERRTDPGKLFDWSRLKVIGQFVHTIHSGDTLWSIAQKYGTTVHAIANWNNIHPQNFLYVGQKILIPIKSRKTIYTVQPGDSLWKISQKFAMSVDVLAKINHLSSNDDLQIGQTLIIPE